MNLLAATIILYTSLTCHWCQLVKPILTQNCIPYKEIVLQHNNSEGINSVPTLVSKGHTYVGYDAIISFATENNQCNK